jgi:hypothetical protein
MPPRTTTRSGRTLAPAVDVGLSHKEIRRKLAKKTKRRKHEKEQAIRDCSADGDVQRSTRAMSSQAQELCSSSGEDDTPSPSPTKKRKARHGITPSCTDFGPHREAQHNKPVVQRLFCDECDLFDKEKDIVPNIKERKGQRH